ncbi:hypothetical protein DQ04_13431020 [Trypanosoma grayi]|uniref:hypothetical protein n=1 Tax=Trypanosoma grayi TaxID=71804 RepID=UPI0004F3F8C9|nr:hypothetical protein DQ04_13431020 [Trypanosoma grayi]KEG06539.1 hypothetical protein DQ04_13431020 [Trypanosoma grayi]
MFKVGPDGSAITYHIPISPFVPLQHNKIDVSTVNRLANFGLRFAMEHGWCHHRVEGPAASHVSEAVDEGYVDHGEDVTVFYAGVDAELIDDFPQFDGEITPASMFFWGQFWVSFVGTSSYGIYGELYHYETDDEGKKVPFGVFKLTGVTVSKTLRKPVPIPKERANVLNETMQRHQKKTSLPKAERINVAEALRYAALFTDASCAHAVERLPTHASVAPLTVAYRREFKLRQSDIDFNRHVNQMAMIQFVINAFRSALEDQTTVFPRLLDAGVEPIIGDLLLRRLRIDYIREIPLDHIGSTVTLFFHDDMARDTLVSSTKGNRQNKVVPLWFIAHGVPKNGGSPFIAVVGYLCVSC